MATQSPTDSILEHFLSDRHLTQCQRDAYNRFVQEDLPNMFLKEFSYPIIYDRTLNQWHVFQIHDMYLVKPTFEEPNRDVRVVYPDECRLRGLSYKSPLRANVTYSLFEGVPPEIQNRINVDNANAATVDLIRKHSAGILHTQYVPGVMFLEIPVMIKSVLCHYDNPTPEALQNMLRGNLMDEGADFIIQGAERLLMYMERLAYNVFLCAPEKECRYTHVGEIRSGHPHTARSSSTSRIHVSAPRKNKKRALFVQFNNKKNENKIEYVPLTIILKALGLGVVEEGVSESDMPMPIDPDDEIRKEWKRAIIHERCWTPFHTELLENTLLLSKHVRTQKEALIAIGKLMNKNSFRPQDSALRFLKREMLSHISYEKEDFSRKAYAFCEYACAFSEQLYMEHLQKHDPSQFRDPIEPWDNKDKYSNKGVETVLDVLLMIIRQIVKHILKQVKTQVKQACKNKRPINVATMWKAKQATKTLFELMGTGLWQTKTGITQRQDRQNMVSTLAQHFRIVSTLPKEGKQQNPRLIWQQYGFVCPFASSEGPACGLMKEFTPLTIVSLATEPDFVQELILEHFSLCILPFFRAPKQGTLIPVKVNGATFAFLTIPSQALQIVQEIKSWRRNNVISHHTSISITYVSSFFSHPYYLEQTGRTVEIEQIDFDLIKAIEIRTDGTRPLRPLIVVENSFKWSKIDWTYTTWNELLSQGIIDYVDQREEESTLVALRLDNLKDTSIPYEYLEIDQMSFLGLAASMLPFSCHNPAPKCTYETQMTKQQKGPGESDHARRPDTNAMRSWMNEIPLGTTRWLSLLRFYRHPMGTNAMVAITTMDGTNEEDGIIVNRGSIDLLFLRSFIERTTSVREKRQVQRSHSLHKQENLEEQCNMLCMRYDNKTSSSKENSKKIILTYEKTPYVFPSSNATSEFREEFGLFDQEECLHQKKEDFSKIERDGIIGIGCKTFSGTIVVQKSVPLPTNKQIAYTNRQRKRVVLKRRDTSISQKKSDYGRVLQVFLSTDSQGDRITRIKITKVAIPLPGDKAASRHGQKGVFTHVYAPEDLPFTNDEHGIVPNLVVDPIGYYARSTKGQDFESMIGTISALLGIQEIDCSSNNLTHLQIIREGLRSMGAELDDLRDGKDQEGFVETIKQILKDIFHHLGLNEQGLTPMRCGLTGQRLESLIFFHPTYYSKLKHMVADKVRARATGQVERNTGQPIAKRATDGGLKFGEMEGDCLKAHGAAENYYDRHCISSDAGITTSCFKCNAPIFENGRVEDTYCKQCATWGTGTIQTLPKGTTCWWEDLLTVGFNITHETKIIPSRNTNYVYTQSV